MGLTIVPNIEKENPIFQRKEFLFTLLHPDEKTPTRMEVKKHISAHYNVDQDLVLVESIKTEYGRCASTVKMRIYEN